ncbi:MAG: hypothetical protein K1X79_07835 [Oligoflexia bacterium]|nr:hypothetical protein [Oligoflexia bacterium]
MCISRPAVLLANLIVVLSLSAVAIAQNAAPKLKLGLTRLGCTSGFSASLKAPDTETEARCDKENLEKFVSILGTFGKVSMAEIRAGSAIQDIEILSFDLDKDGCVTCNDFFEWKRALQVLHRIKDRSNDGAYISLDRCAEPS